MTTVVFSKDRNGLYKGFYCMGHAGYAKKGKPDILCAAVSAWTVGTVNALEEIGKVELTTTVNDETGFLKCEIKSVLSKECIFLMDSLVLTLTNLSRKYGEQFLQVKFEEV